MSKLIDLTVVAVDRPIFKGSVTAVFATGVQGAFEIRPGHAHFLTQLVAGHIYYDASGTNARQGLYIEGGVLEATPTGVIALINQAILASEINEQEEQKRIDNAREQLKKHEKLDYATVLADLNQSIYKINLLKDLRKVRK